MLLLLGMKTFLYLKIIIFFHHLIKILDLDKKSLNHILILHLILFNFSQFRILIISKYLLSL